MIESCPSESVFNLKPYFVTHYMWNAEKSVILFWAGFQLCKNEGNAWLLCKIGVRNNEIMDNSCKTLNTVILKASNGG